MKTKEQKKAFQEEQMAEYIADIPIEKRAEWKEFLDELVFVDVDEEGEAGFMMPVSAGFMKKLRK